MFLSIMLLPLISLRSCCKGICPLSLQLTYIINPLPNDKHQEKSQFKVFANDKINVSYEQKWIENIVGKGKNAGYVHFLLFPQCFQKASFSGPLNVGIVW